MSSLYRLSLNPNFSENGKEADCGESENDHISVLNQTRRLQCMAQISILKEEKQIENYDNA